MMFVCIELRVPLFLVGKPGSSKSLAKSIIENSLKGKNSKRKVMKKFKQVQMYFTLTCLMYLLIIDSSTFSSVQWFVYSCQYNWSIYKCEELPGEERWWIICICGCVRWSWVSWSFTLLTSESITSITRRWNRRIRKYYRSGTLKLFV